MDPIYLELRKLFNRYDLMNLEPGVEAPDDEYDPEIDEIIKLFNNNLNQEQTYDLLLVIFVRLFGLDTTDLQEGFIKKVCGLAEEVFVLLKSHE